MSTSPPIQCALISTSNKSGLVNFATQLTACGIHLMATGGTAKFLTEHSIPVIEVADYTGFPEILDGRVKTLHPKIHAGLLARRGVDDTVLLEHQITRIDLLIANLYPFQETIANPQCSLEQAIEQIDIGGPCMIRAAAKNYANVTVIIDPNDYQKILQEIIVNGRVNLNTRLQLAQKAFSYTTQYDSAIAAYLQIPCEKMQTANVETASAASIFPNTFSPLYIKKHDLRYGENPHQHASIYIESDPSAHGIATATLIQGKPLSFNNILDGDTALRCVSALDPELAGCVIVKHATPCGAAQADNLIAAYQRAYAADVFSTFGGIIGFNQPVTGAVARTIIDQQFVEVLLAPDFDSEALALLKNKPNLRVLSCARLDAKYRSYALQSVSGGLLVQEHDINLDDHLSNWTIVTERHPQPDELSDLLFAWHIAKFVKSNAIVLAKEQATLGIGAGQTSRVFSTQIAILKAQQANFSLSGSVMASDAFFPFADGVEIAASAGVTAIIQPGGSMRDAEVIAAANRNSIAMIFTGIRHFRH